MSPLRWIVLVAGMVAGMEAGPTAAADLDKAALQAAVSQAAERYEKAFAARDAKALAALFTTEAEYVDATGTVFHGRDAIQAEYAASFEVDPPGKVAIEIISLRPVAAGVVVEEGISVFRPEQKNGVSTQLRYTATHVKQADGGWLLAAIRELEPPRLTPHGRLVALSWLEGSWREEGEGGVVETVWKWSEDGNFLVSEFSARRSNQIRLKGTHRIGWDAERKQFHSWLFESDGGSADGWWSEAADGAWTVQMNGVDSDGARISANATYLRDGADAIVISQDHRTRGGLTFPAVSHRIVRQPPAAAPQAAAK